MCCTTKHGKKTSGYDCHSQFLLRHFISKDEKINCLKKYAEQLENELKGVQEEIEELDK